MEGHKVPVFLITGPPGAGKSTVSSALMRRFPFGLHLLVDDLREWVVSGIAHPVPGWTEETTRQFRLARAAAADVAQRYADAGFAVVLDDIIGPAEANEWLASWAHGLDVCKVLLWPSLQTTLLRNAARAGKTFDTAILHQPIHEIWAWMARADYAAAGWVVIDNSLIDVETTVDAILAGCG